MKAGEYPSHRESYHHDIVADKAASETIYLWKWRLTAAENGGGRKKWYQREERSLIGGDRGLEDVKKDGLADGEESVALRTLNFELEHQCTYLVHGAQVARHSLAAMNKQEVHISMEA